MPSITINGTVCEFEAGQTILQIANANAIEIPQYCYHDGLSIVASCRICLAEVWGPNPRNDNKLEPIPKLLPACQTPAGDGQIVYTDSPKAMANQKAVMEYLLINHPLDCPVCDQAGECFLQDYSYEYGRGVSRFEETKVKQPKKNLGEHVYLYSDRCIMCSRCVRFTREVAGTSELIVQGRGNRTEIDIFPGKALDNELSANVIDLCPVGALLDKDFLFAQRVWFLKTTPSIDGITASGDNLHVDHNQGKVFRLRPRTNMAINRWWITDEVRYGWKHVHGDQRVRSPRVREFGAPTDGTWSRAVRDTLDGCTKANGDGKRLMVVVSPMLPCEEAFALADAARTIDQDAVLAVGPVPIEGQNKTFPADDPDGFTMVAEKCPNARGVRRVLEQFGGAVLGFDEALDRLGRGMGSSDVGALIITGGYPTDWITDDLLAATSGKFICAIDPIENRLTERADVVMPGASWLEKAGTFQNWQDRLQAFEAAIPTQHQAKTEGQIAADLLAMRDGGTDHSVESRRALVVDEAPGSVPSGIEVAPPIGAPFNAAHARVAMVDRFPALSAFTTDIQMPVVEHLRESDMELVEL